MRHRHLALALALAGHVLAPAALLPAQGASLVRDLRTAPVALPRSGSQPSDFTALGAGAVFSARTAATGRELFWTDGTPAATTLLADLAPGVADGDPRHLTTLGNTCWFSAWTRATGRELWCTDGTAAGTRFVKDLVPGIADADPHAFTALGGFVYFLLGDGSFDLWRTDGTTAGTTLVRSNGTAGTPGRGAMIAHNNRLWFAAPGLFTSDGTAAGTVPLPGTIRPREFAVGGSEVFTHDGLVLYRCATPAPVVMQIAPHGVHDLTGGGTHVYFARTRMTLVQGIPHYHDELWRADATSAVAFVASPVDAKLLQVTSQSVWFAAPSPAGTTIYRDSVANVHLTVPAQELLAFHDGDVYWLEPAGLQRYDAASSTTIALGPYDRVHGGWERSSSGVFLFTRDDPALGTEPYRTDGSQSGTTALADLDPTPASGETESAEPEGFFDAAGLVYFSAIGDGIGRELFVTDGTSSGTRLVRDLVPGPDGSDPREFALLGPEVVFATLGRTQGMWITDGSAANTRLLVAAREPRHVVSTGEKVFFQAQASDGDYVLWRTDGTAAGTMPVQPLGFREPALAVAVGRALFFAMPFRGLWRVEGDGTPSSIDSGILPLAHLVRGDELWLAAVKNRLYGLWRVHASGTGAGLQVDLANIGGSTVQWMHEVNGQIVFWCFVGQDAIACASDGTTAGTVLLPIRHAVGGLLQRIGSAGGTAIVRTPGLLHTSDGSVAGTSLQSTIWQRAGPSTIRPGFTYAVAVGDRKLYFPEDDGETGIELWGTDGTATGTQRLTDTNPGSLAGQYAWSEPVLANGRLLFAARDPAHGGELWALDVGASAQPVGFGCAAAVMPPALSADDPLLGARVDARLRFAAPSRFGALVGSPPSPGFRHTHLGGGCTLYFDAASVVWLPFATDATGRATIPVATVPNTMALAGTRMMLQAATLETTPTPLGVDLSNGVLLVVGQP